MGRLVRVISALLVVIAIEFAMPGAVALGSLAATAEIAYNPGISRGMAGTA